MNSQDVFEIFNHFLKTKDSDQILSIANDVEVFGSTSFADGRSYIGESAPERFRETIAVLTNAKTSASLKVKHVILNDDNSVFFLNVSKGRKVSGSVLNIALKDGQLKCFHEAAAKV